MTAAVTEPPPALPAAPSTTLDLFLALVRIASPSGSEGRVMGAIETWLSNHGVTCARDGAAVLTGSDTGNLIARRFVSADRPTVLFVAHVDTVQAPGDQIEPVVDSGGVITSAGATILGADNKAAVAALLSLLAHPRPAHANLITVFSTCEERGRMGATALEWLAGEVDFAFPVDGSYPVGTVLEAALGQVPFELQVHGRRAHAAKDPEQGVHAIQAACEIVAGLELGRLEDSILNISAVGGGAETNVIPDFAELRGEARAFSPEAGAPPFPPSTAGANLAVVQTALSRLGIPMLRESCSATLEANFLHSFGMPTLGIASGGRGPHSIDESLPTAELDRLLGLLDAILTVAAEDVTESVQV